MNKVPYFLKKDAHFLNEHAYFLNEHAYFLNEHAYFLNEHAYFLNEHAYFLNEDAYFLNEDAYFLSELHIKNCSGSINSETHIPNLQKNQQYNNEAFGLFIDLNSFPKQHLFPVNY